MTLKFPARCPGCDQAPTGIEDVAGGPPAAPEPGDLSVCTHCGIICRFEATGAVPLTTLDLAHYDVTVLRDLAAEQSRAPARIESASAAAVLERMLHAKGAGAN
jgi:hypothetical protein